MFASSRSAILFIRRRPSAGSNGLVRQVAGGWEISGIWTMQSGYPFSIVGGDGNNNSGALQGGDRADYVPGQAFEVHQGSKAQWLNTYFNPRGFCRESARNFWKFRRRTPLTCSVIKQLRRRPE